MTSGAPSIVSRISLLVTDWESVIMTRNGAGKMSVPTTEYDRDLNGGLDDTLGRAIEKISSKVFKGGFLVRSTKTAAPVRLKDIIVHETGKLVMSYVFLIEVCSPLGMICEGVGKNDVSVVRLSDLIECRFDDIDSGAMGIIDSNSEYLKKHILPTEK
jgi:hypothetical protein